MNKNDYLDLTKEFPEISDLIEKRKVLRNNQNKVSRKLRTLFNEYIFLPAMISEGVKDDVLEEYVKAYFKKIGFKNVQKVGKQLQKEDLRIVQKDKIIIAEITGTNKRTSKDSKTSQILKHLNVRRKAGENAYAVFIVNHDNEKPISERNNKPFSDDQIKYAEAGGYGLITTLDLIDAFKKYKLNQLSMTEFESKLCSFGHIMF